ncbi:ABC transporter permease [Motilibacter aurantiacus]|uniref:ABC transporter permease n=1 Tax=Motilibacter aurantiacus TaxID=2714955 RepID=UPI00140C8396|nr:ABC transporter permease [Motilibacter aurantiacus]NHC47662.1 ABC transporter permease [Motilibacter aurantiacus]
MSATPSSRPVQASDLSTAGAVRLVARREFVERGRDRSFLVSTAVTLLILVAVTVISTLVGGDDESYDVGLGPDAAAAATTLQAQAAALDVEVSIREVTPEEARTLVQDGDLDAALTAPGQAVVKEELEGTLRALLEQASAGLVGEERLRQAGIDPGQVRAALDVAPLRIEALDPPDEDAERRQGIAFVGTLLLYGQVFGYGFWVALGVVEEKSSRVVEVLLATVPPRALLAGKILGIGLLGLVQLLVLGVIGVAVAVATGAVDLGGEVITPMALVLAWFLLGFAFYATAFAAAAARVSRQEDLQNVTTPMTLVILGSFFAAIWASSSPDEPLARVLAIVPPFSVLVNPPRTAAGDVAAWEVGLAIVLMIAAIVALAGVAAKLYEGAVLRTGAALSWREAWRGRNR